ncbi:MAG: PilZ domain-containing protein [Gammaproteobacteria bacterium]|nr:PilZ domain-containing protein [Gammaproteobacteria bacterium]
MSDGATQGGMLNIHIPEKSILYMAYMPFLKNGGIFIPSQKRYELGEEIFLFLTLIEDKEKIPVACKVVWMTPKGAQGGKKFGIGVEFNKESSKDICGKIETHLAGVLKSDRATYTM